MGVRFVIGYNKARRVSPWKHADLFSGLLIAGLTGTSFARFLFWWSPADQPIGWRQRRMAAMMQHGLFSIWTSVDRSYSPASAGSSLQQCRRAASGKSRRFPRCAFSACLASTPIRIAPGQSSVAGRGRRLPAVSGRLAGRHRDALVPSPVPAKWRRRFVGRHTGRPATLCESAQRYPAVHGRGRPGYRAFPVCAADRSDQRLARYGDGASDGA